MNMKAGLTFACMNLKKLAKMLAIREEREQLSSRFFDFISEIYISREKWCWS